MLRYPTSILDFLTLPICSVAYPSSHRDNVSTRMRCDRLNAASRPFAVPGPGMTLLTPCASMGSLSTKLSLLSNHTIEQGRAEFRLEAADWTRPKPGPRQWSWSEHMFNMGDL